MYDTEDPVQENINEETSIDSDVETISTSSKSSEDTVNGDSSKPNVTPESESEQKSENEQNSTNEAKEEASNECDVCNENRIYNVFKNLREKFSFGDT